MAEVITVRMVHSYFRLFACQSPLLSTDDEELTLRDVSHRRSNDVFSKNVRHASYSSDFQPKRLYLVFAEALGDLTIGQQ